MATQASLPNLNLILDQVAKDKGIERSVKMRGETGVERHRRSLRDEESARDRRSGGALQIARTIASDAPVRATFAFVMLHCSA